jgi:cold shock CspA family protein
MDGTVVAYDADEGTGEINARDGKKYVFVRADLLDSGIEPATGLIVSFEPTGLAASKIRITGRAILLK